MGKENRGAKAARAAAQAARQEAQIEERARERRVRLIGGLVVVLIMGGLLAIPLMSGKNDGPATDGSAKLPTGVTKDTYGVKIGPAWTSADADTIPMLQIWEDFQCPACGSMEKASGQTILDLANQGKIRLEYRPTIFLDGNLKAENAANGNPDSSLRATAAFGCAVDQGKAAEYHAAIFAAQPATEGVGFSDDQLLSFGQGIMDETQFAAFSTCVSSGEYKSWVQNSYDLFSKEGVTSTPTGILNGKELPSDTLFDVAKITQAITDASAS